MGEGTDSLSSEEAPCGFAGTRQGRVRGRQVPGSPLSPLTAASPLEDPAPPSLPQPLDAPRSPQHAPGLLQLCGTHTPPGMCPQGGGDLELSLQREPGSPVREAPQVFLCLREHGSAGPPGRTEAARHESLHKCRCSTPRKGSARRGVPGSKAADGSHAWGTVCLPSGTILPAWPPHAVQGQASGLGQWAETAPLGPPAGCKARRKGPKDSLPGSKERERETLTR